jgi:6-phosphofructokinase 2
MTTTRILTVTLNPALDITTAVGRVTPRLKLRCGPPRYDAGGGGVNVSRAIKELGGTSRAFVMLGGANGAVYRDVLAQTGIEQEIWLSQGETRFSLTVMEDETGDHYRFLLPGPSHEGAEAERLLADLARSLDSGIRFVVASGSLPPGLPVDFYARLARAAHETAAAMIVDASGPTLLATLKEKPYCVRLNHHEALEILGGGSDQPPEQLAHKLVATGAAQVAIVTIGDHGAIVATPARWFRVRPPMVEVRSPVGAGDSFVGALALGLSHGWSLEDASRLGVAAAASAVTTEATELCKRESTERFFESIAIERSADA